MGENDPLDESEVGVVSTSDDSRPCSGNLNTSYGNIAGTVAGGLTVQSVSQPIRVDYNGSTGILPEEGLKGWLCAVGSFFSMFSTFGFLNAIGIFQDTYQDSILSDRMPSDIAWIFSIQIALMWLPGPLYGRIVDTYGPGPILFPAAFLCIFALAITSLCTEYYQIFLAQGLAFGIGASGVFTTSFICCGQWFVRRRGLGVGIASAGSGLGGTLFPIFFDRVKSNIGFVGAVRYTALFIGILLVASCLLVTARLPRKKWNHDLPWFDLTVFSARPFALYCIGCFLAQWGSWAAADFLPGMTRSIGYSETQGLYMLSIFNAASIAGRIIPPYLGDKIGHFNVISASALLGGVSVLSFWIPFDFYRSLAGLVVFCIVNGFAIGGIAALLMTCAAKSGSIETIGVRFGTLQPVVATSTLTGLPIMGAILDTQGDDRYTGLQSFAAATLTAAGLFYFTSRGLLSKNQGTWKV